MKLIANKPIRYRGVRYTAGVEFETDEKWGDLLQRTGQARLAEDQAPARRRGRPPGSGKKLVEHQAVPPVTTADITSDELDTHTQDDA